MPADSQEQPMLPNLSIHPPARQLQWSLAGAGNMARRTGGRLGRYLSAHGAGPWDSARSPDGPIFLVMRLYWPKEEALKSEWKPPVVVAVKWF